MAALLPNPVPQFCDADGNPFAGGTIETYVPGTSTPKATWLDPLQAALNTNPIILDAAGRCVMYGDGDYRLILRDAVGNEIWDQPSSTLVSAAMQPVMSAPTRADAVHLLGLDDVASAADIAAAVSTEAAARTAADAALGTRIDNEITRATAAEGALGTRVTALETAPPPTVGITGVQGGVANADGGGHATVVFPTPFATQCISAVVTPESTLFVSQTPSVNLIDRFSFEVRITVGGSSTPVSGGGFTWMAVGS